MKNTNSKYTEVIADYIKANPGATLDSIKEGNPKVSHVMVVKALKDLQAENLITISDEDGSYTFVTGKKPASVAQPKDEKKDVAKKTEEEDLGAPTVTGRDNTKYAFNGQSKLSKGRLVHSVIKKYTESNPKASLTKIEEVFDSKTIQPRFGVIAEHSAAKKMTKNNVDRYFLKPEDILKVGDKKIAVCNQWSADTLKPFLKIAASLGMKIKAE
jgi:hypothetical protein